LSDAARETAELESSHDPLETAGMYGTIANKAVRRRTARRYPLPMSSLTAPAPIKASASASKPSGIKEAKNVSSANAKPDVKPSQTSKDIPNKGSQEKKNTPVNPPQLKRDSSSIFKSFAKTKPPLKREGTDSSAAASGIDSAPPSGPEDELMKDMSEGEEDDYIPPPMSRSEAPIDANRKSRKEREAALKQMMEDDEDLNEKSDVVLEDTQPESPKDTPPSQLTEEVVQVTGGRRRGRRRVMKKKTIKDEEGYLGKFTGHLTYYRTSARLCLCFTTKVTREEPAWEFFSEDEPVKPKSKPPSSLPPSSDKSKKGAGKAGQGSIMSFFGKK
jgi:DNA polymerase delta subunit 3